MQTPVTPEIVLITGASSGFGEACARKFAQHGVALVLAARRLDRLQALQQELGATCPIHVAQLDVQDADAVAKFIPSLPESFRAIDILVNNAGLALGMNSSDKADLRQWETMVDTNIKGLMRMTRHVLPGMVERDRGHIVNIGSVAGSWPYPGGNTYAATKAFVQHFSRGLRSDLLGKHIRVSNIEPGLAETEFSIVRLDGDAEKAAKVYEGTQPLTGEDIAEIVFWVTRLPPHVNINAVEVMPTCQAWLPFAISREMAEKD